MRGSALRERSNFTPQSQQKSAVKKPAGSSLVSKATDQVSLAAQIAERDARLQQLEQERQAAAQQHAELLQRMQADLAAERAQTAALRQQLADERVSDPSSSFCCGTM